MALTDLRATPLLFEANEIAIAVTHSRIGDGHIGICFHSPKDGPKVLHLAWHEQLRINAIPGELQFCWAGEVLGLPPATAKAVVGIVRAVAARRATIRYGLNFIAAYGSFYPNGKYKPPRGSDGLTCASFVVEVLRAAMVNLVREDTWRADAANEAWCESVCALLTQQGVDADHVTSVRRNISGLRMRPFEVAGAARLGPRYWPADFDSVQGPAMEIRTDLHAICPPPAAGAAQQAEQ
jgi:hypothetical protein